MPYEPIYGGSAPDQNALLPVVTPPNRDLCEIASSDGDIVVSFFAL